MDKWSEFQERIEGELPRLYEVRWSGVLPSVVYDEFIRAVLRQKRSSFRAFYESLDPSQVINQIWVTLRALSSRSGALRTNVLTDMNSSEFRALRDDLVREDVSPADIPLSSGGVGIESFNELFTRKKLDSAMVACRAKSAPGPEGISYDVQRKARASGGA